MTDHEHRWLPVLREPAAIEPVELPDDFPEPGERPTLRQRRSAWRALLKFLPDVGRLLYDLARDPRVPWHAKAVAAGAVAYVISPVDVVPDIVPGVGRMDDVYIVGKALRYLFNAAGYALLREHWRGGDDGFALLLVVAGIGR